MSETSPPARPTRSYEKGQVVPMPDKKIEIKPSRFADGPKTSPRGVFRNGRGK